MQGKMRSLRDLSKLTLLKARIVRNVARLLGIPVVVEYNRL